MTTNHTPELDALLHQAMEADFQAEKARKLKNFQYLNQDDLVLGGGFIV